MPVWPGSPDFELESISSLLKDGVNGTKLICDSHSGTHVDAPLHFLENGDSVDLLSLELLIGAATVVELPETDAIRATDLESLELDSGVRRLLIKTENSRLWEREERSFTDEYVALTADAAHWVVERGIRLVGIDYLSIGRLKRDGRATHRTLLQAGVVVLEGLNLSQVQPGEYELICLPLKVIGAEGAPARAVLRRPTKTGDARG
ncbi:MAG: cyclase family protein [Candidatus Aquicultorales bacterium]